MSPTTVEDGNKVRDAQLRLERPSVLGAQGRPLCGVPTDGLFVKILWGYRKLSCRLAEHRGAPQLHPKQPGLQQTQLPSTSADSA